eukprot:COSAG02_NODE_19217_length_894_cov_1.154717_2_plen_72_part_01
MTPVDGCWKYSLPSCNPHSHPSGKNGGRDHVVPGMPMSAGGADVVPGGADAGGTGGSLGRALDPGVGPTSVQ